MAYSSTYESSTTSSTSTTTTTAISTGDETSSSSLSVDMTVQSTTSDGSDGLAAALGGEAIALGEDTLTVGTVSASMESDDSLTSLDGSATMVAASEDPDGGAEAITDTFAEVSDGAEFVFVVNVDESSSEQNETGSTATSTSTTDITAYNLEQDGGDSVTAADPVSEDEFTDVSEPSEESDLSSYDDDLDIEGNIAIAEFDATATGEDTFASADAFTLAIEDELSISGVIVELAAD